MGLLWGLDTFCHVPHPTGNSKSFLSPCWQSYLRELGEALQGRVRQCSCVHCVRNNFIGWLSKEGSAYLVICKCSSSIEQTSNRIWIHLACSLHETTLLLKLKFQMCRHSLSFAVFQVWRTCHVLPGHYWKYHLCCQVSIRVLSTSRWKITLATVLFHVFGCPPYISPSLPLGYTVELLYNRHHWDPTFCPL